MSALVLPYLMGRKKVGEKWLNFLQVTKFFPDFFFPTSVSSRYFFRPKKNLSRFFFQLLLLLLLLLFFFFIIIIIVLLLIIITYLFAKFIITMFFWCTLIIVVEETSFNENFEMRVKARNWKKYQQQWYKRNKKLYIRKL